MEGGRERERERERELMPYYSFISYVIWSYSATDK